MGVERLADIAYESAVEWLSNKLEQMHRRLRAAGDCRHLYPDDVQRADGTRGPVEG